MNMWIVAEVGHYIEIIELLWEEDGWSRERKDNIKAAWNMRLLWQIKKAVGSLAHCGCSHACSITWSFAFNSMFLCLRRISCLYLGVCMLVYNEAQVTLWSTISQFQVSSYSLHWWVFPVNFTDLKKTEWPQTLLSDKDKKKIEN